MIQIEVQICRIDNKEIGISPAYKLINWLLPDVAKSLTYTIVIPRDEDG